MAMVTGNRLLPLLAGIVLLLTALVVVKSCSENDDAVWMMDAVPQVTHPDADTPADTLKTLTANVSAMTAEVSALRQENATLKQANQGLVNDRSQIENRVMSRLKETLNANDQAKGKQQTAQRQQEASRFAELTARVDRLSQMLSQQPESIVNNAVSSDIPIGLGLDRLNSSAQVNDTLVWIEPIERTVLPPHQTGGLLNRLGPSTQRTLNRAVAQKDTLLASGANVFDSAFPVYTIPRNATLIGSTAMTALVGRVPVQGQVRDPKQFKVITGRDNLAANGLSVPGVAGMIWTGTAIGDWTLSCVSGELESVTFVFDDGTIQTLSSDDNSLKNTGNSQDKPLGWISDARGIPCISGARKTNAPAFLSQRFGVAGIEAAAEAAAQSETTTLVSNEGNTSRQLTGDAGQFVLGKTLSGGSQAMAQWLAERQAQHFDAIFVPAGIELAIHVDHELPLDFNPNGRRLYHGNPINPPKYPSSVSTLD